MVEVLTGLVYGSSILSSLIHNVFRDALKFIGEKLALQHSCDAGEIFFSKEIGVCHFIE